MWPLLATLEDTETDGRWQAALSTTTVRRNAPLRQSSARRPAGSLERCIEMLEGAGHWDAGRSHDRRLGGCRSERDSGRSGRRDADRRETAGRRRRVVERRHHRREWVERRRRSEVDVAEPVA